RGAAPARQLDRRRRGGEGARRRHRERGAGRSEEGPRAERGALRAPRYLGVLPLRPAPDDTSRLGARWQELRSPLGPAWALSVLPALARSVARCRPPALLHR